jgi:pimeloyl-ACP methyl ester carboxylesterase
MTSHEDASRRRFLGAAVATMVGRADRSHANARAVARRNTPVAAAEDTAGASAGLGTPNQIAAGVLDVGYTDAGPVDGPVVILLHGWPYDVHSFLEVVPLLVSAGHRVVVPHLRGFGTTRFLASDARRNGQQAALALDVIALMNALRIDKAVVAGFDWGARTANIVAALWPDRCRGLVAVSGYLIASREGNRTPLTPRAEYAWWYQYYFATQRGERGYREHTRDFARLIWGLASPAWRFDDVTFDRSARSFDNPDHVPIVIHNYRWRLGLDPGEPRYDPLEAALSKAPVIAIPTVTLQGDADGAPHPDSHAYAAKFVGRYAHRVVAGGIGHNLPQEAPRAFAQAVIDVARA